ncbi:Nam8p Ecym_8010 [Eremothecium cymbalariae DBVPG|uniref:RRM domain-containing protein n=1 Tax=Eremothecium cymbalariae (strain CBS 270.75 / DBVPG 7215 / KCTC 17166 / NRRL Y-17582) TaxID=931890 RepID=G8JWT3_ERECY|nr:Hypothetical protein Ecym_8010 [Eremothecium cymbalariae DBVPG\
MSFNSSYNSQVMQDYTYNGAGQFRAQQNSALTRQLSASSAASTSSNGPETTSTQLYMGDLDASWTENDIKQIWATLGEPNVQVKLIKNSGPMNNSGYCFVEFPSNLSATNALLKTGLPIPVDPSRSLKLNWASFATAPGTEFSIFVGDLAPNVSESQLFELFISRYSSTLNAKIVFDQVTGVSKGYGFVKFGNEAEQQRSLVEMQGVFLNGRAIRVSTTSKNKSRFRGGLSGTVTSAAAATAGPPVGNLSGVIQTSSPQTLPQQSQFIYPVQQQPVLSQFTDPNNTTVFIGGLSSLVTEEELRAYFQPFGQIVYVKIPVGKGCGFVQYVDRSSAENAIAKMQGFPIGNSRIRLSWGRSAKQAAGMQQVFAMTLQHQQPQKTQQQQQHHNHHHNTQQSIQESQKHRAPQQQQQTAANNTSTTTTTVPNLATGGAAGTTSAGTAQPLLQQQLQQQFPYQQQPAMPQTYSYTLDSISGTGSNYVPMSHIPPIQLTYQSSAIIDPSSSSALLPNLTTLDYSGFPSSNNSNFNFSPSTSLGAGFNQQVFDYSNSDMGTPMAQTPNTAASTQSTKHPQIFVQGGEAYVKGRNSSIDRLEQGSNGYIFV